MEEVNGGASRPPAVPPIRASSVSSVRLGLERLSSVRAKAAATVSAPLSALDRGRATSKLLRHPKLQPYMNEVAPLLPKLAPHAHRIVDSVETLGSHVPALVHDLPRLLPHLGALLDELPHLAPHLDDIVPHREPLLQSLDHIVPHFAALRPHLAELAPLMPAIAPCVERVAPYLAALLPHLDALLRGLPRVPLSALERLAADGPIRLLLPHIGQLAPHLSELAPHLPRLIDHLSDEASPLRQYLPALFTNLPAILPHMARLLEHTERLGGRLGEVLSHPDAISSALDVLEVQPQEEAGVWGAIISFFGGDGTAAHAPGSHHSNGNGHAAPEIPPDRGPDLTAVNEAISFAARRMAKLESSFVAMKRDHAYHSSLEQDMALKCAKLEATLVSHATIQPSACLSDLSLSLSLTHVYVCVLRWHRLTLMTM